MGQRAGRVLWLIQHRTLTQAEVPILRRLGYEVFVPKVFIPASHHRSSGVTYEFDDSLTIPAHVLKTLNETDFYREGLPADVVEYINEYFDAAFFIVLEALHINMLRHFRGPLIMRAFGVIEPQTYFKALAMWGRGGIELVAAAQQRFWFGVCYPRLETVEPPLLADRTTYLPIAMPAAFAERHADTWTGDTRQILLICPDIAIDPSAGQIYRHFKREYGDLPHVIVGKQSVPIDDPQVVGFVTDDELVELMRTSAALLYLSREPRMMQYPPVEAAVMGLPVVFYRDSLLGSLIGAPVAGAIDDDVDGRALLTRLLSGDRAASDTVRVEQRVIAERFSERWCEDVWSEHLERSGIRSAIESAPASVGLDDFDIADPDRFVSREQLVVPLEPIDTTPLDRGIRLSRINLSTAIAGTHGLGEPEDWGRWVHGRRATILLSEPVVGDLEIQIVGGATDVNWRRPIEIRLGDGHGRLHLDGWIDSLTKTRTTVHVSTPTSLLTITAPESLIADGDRELSIGISRLWVRRRPSPLYRAARRTTEGAARGLRRLARTAGAGRVLRALRSSLRRPRS